MATSIPFYYEASSSIFYLGMSTNQNFDIFWTRKYTIVQAFLLLSVFLFFCRSCSPFSLAFFCGFVGLSVAFVHVWRVSTYKRWRKWIFLTTSFNGREAQSHGFRRFWRENSTFFFYLWPNSSFRALLMVLHCASLILCIISRTIKTWRLFLCGLCSPGM